MYILVFRTRVYQVERYRGHKEDLRASKEKDTPEKALSVFGVCIFKRVTRPKTREDQ